MTRAADRGPLERPTLVAIWLALDGAGYPIDQSTRMGQPTRQAASQGLDELSASRDRHYLTMPRRLPRLAVRLRQ